MSARTTTTPQLIRVGDLSRQTGKTVRAIHLYEELGLLEPAKRSSGGFRLYNPSAVERVRWIDLLHSLGFSLPEMRELLRSWWSAELGPEAMDRMRTLFQRKLEETRAALERYAQLEGELKQGLSYLETCRECVSASTVRACLACSQDHGMTGEPALLAGLKTLPRARGRRTRSDIVPVEDIG